jgi:hypothetical protein
MIYGGDYPNVFLSFIMGPNASRIQHDPAGAYYVRFAQYPWGPWSAPQVLFQAGVYTNPATLQYGNNGMLFSPFCSGTCAALDPYFQFPFFDTNTRVGRMYAPAIVPWDPYEVVMLKTRLNP